MEAEERGLSLDDALAAVSRLAHMRCPKVALERLEKAGGGGAGWTLQPRRLDLYISPGAVSEIIARLASVPESRPYSFWTPKVHASLAMALEAYQPWVAGMMAGLGGAAQVEPMLSTLGVALPRAFCEATSKALMAALDLPCLFTSFETFRHVRDRLSWAGPTNQPRQGHQQRLSCLNTLLYLRQLGASELPAVHDKTGHPEGGVGVGPNAGVGVVMGTPAAPPLLQLPTSLAEEVLGIFTDIYRTILALGFEEASNFESLVEAVGGPQGGTSQANSPRAASKLFLEGLGTGV
jgi:hypothetical protein